MTVFALILTFAIGLMAGGLTEAIWRPITRRYYQEPK